MDAIWRSRAVMMMMIMMMTGKKKRIKMSLFFLNYGSRFFIPGWSWRKGGFHVGTVLHSLGGEMYATITTKDSEFNARYRTQCLLWWCRLYIGLFISEVHLRVEFQTWTLCAAITKRFHIPFNKELSSQTFQTNNSLLDKSRKPHWRRGAYDEDDERSH